MTRSPILVRLCRSHEVAAEIGRLGRSLLRFPFGADHKETHAALTESSRPSIYLLHSILDRIHEGAGPSEYVDP